MVNQRIRSLEKKLEKTAAELVPPQYHVYLNVFKKKASECMPLCKPWDHAIDLVLDFKPIKSRIYPCSSMEQAEIDAFIDDQFVRSTLFLVPSPQRRQRKERMMIGNVFLWMPIVESQENKTEN